MPRTLHLTIEAAGCSTVCAHCWAQGGPYKNMSIEDVAFVLEEGRAASVTAGADFAPCPMHELLARPDALEMLRLCAQHMSVSWKSQFEPLTTTGVALGARADWKELLAGVKSLGTSTLWLAFHGLEEVHDRLVGRKGAFKKSCVAVERARGGAAMRRERLCQ